MQEPRLARRSACAWEPCCCVARRPGLRVRGRPQSHENVNRRSRNDYHRSASFRCARIEEVEIIAAQFTGDAPVVEDQQALKTSPAVMVGAVDGFEVGKFTTVAVKGRGIGSYGAFDGRWD